MADTKKHYLAFPKGGKKPTREEAEELGRRLFDAIASEQAANARDDETKRRK